MRISRQPECEVSIIYNYQILTKEQYPELDEFVNSHPQGGFTQCSAWAQVKSNWGFEAVVVRDETNAIVGSVAVLIQKIPLVGSAFLYAPRGPVCDLQNEQILSQLKEGVDALAKQYNAHSFKMDPDTLLSNQEFIAIAKRLGFTQSYGPDGFEGIQARFNYRLYLEGRSEEQLFMSISQSARRKVRIAQKNNVEVQACDASHLPEFHRIMQVTGERDGFNIRPIAYFERFLEALGEHARLYMGFYEGQAVCGAITTNFARKCCYVYGASDNVHRNVMPNYLMQWEMIRWAIETNCEVYDFQGVSGNLSPEDNPMYGLYQFKSGFNGTLDELAGEFDFVYRPLAQKMTDVAIAANDRLSQVKRKLGR